jgi:hypothetical protein
MYRRFVASLLLIVILLSACKLGQPPAAPAASAQPAASEPPPAPPEATQAPTEAAPPPVETPPPAPPALPPEPQPVTFQAGDGQELRGLYYPAAVQPSPVVVLMHWVGGDMSDWYEIAVWLQNRGQKNPFANPGDASWWDPAWFPPVPEGVSYGVFIFSFRGCAPSQAGCANWTPEVWLLDAQAAMLKATELEGADTTMIAAFGSSIGADGAPDACAWLDEQMPGSCKGALSLSPGGFLEIPYPVPVQQLGGNQPPVAAWCLADETEFSFCEMAEMAGNPAYRDFMIPGGQHGNMLLRPGLDPLPMQIILDFLDEVFGE